MIPVYTYIVNLIISSLSWFFDKLLWFIFDFGQWAWDYIMVNLETVLSFSGYPADLAWSSEYYAKLNFIFPLNELISVLTFMFAFWLGCFVLKIILKAIPTVY